jgi:hypothetical protein
MRGTGGACGVGFTAAARGGGGGGQGVYLTPPPKRGGDPKRGMYRREVTEGKGEASSFTSVV